MVHQPVQDNAQRIEIRPAIVGLSPVHLRRHVAVRSFFRQGAYRLFHLSGDTEISQLEITEPGNKDILRFYITVYDIQPAAVLQGLAEVDPKPDDLLLGETSFRTVIRKGGKVFHPNENIPADLIQIFGYLEILYGNNMGISAEIFHGADFLDAVFHERFEIFSGRFFVSGLGTYALQFFPAGRNRYDLDGRVKGMAMLCPFCLIHRTRRPFSGLFYDLPFRPWGNRQFSVHIGSSFL